MARWDVAVQVERRSNQPIFRQIAQAIRSDIRRGRLRPGDRLPGTRTLARSLGVQRLTVVSAYEELAAEGWIVSRRARGSFVARAVPDPAPRRFAAHVVPFVAAPRVVGVPLAPASARAPARAAAPDGTLLFAPCRSDDRLFPADAIARAYRRAIRHGGASLLSYGPPEGHPRLRAAVATMLAATRGLPITPANVCITRGSQMALALLARTLLRPGDTVAVEELGYRPAWEAFRQAGARLEGLPVDEAGVQVDAIERFLRRGPLRALYLTPHHQFPTTATLADDRRVRLLELARRHRFAIIEDDYDHEFHYDGRPVLPMASADAAGVVAYVGTMSRVLAPALRIGYLAGPAELIRHAAGHRAYIDTQGDAVLEYALADLLEAGEIARHVRRVRREYAARRDAMVAALRRDVPELAFVVPAGGIAVWARSPENLDVDAWAGLARGAGVEIATAAGYTLDGRPRPFVRLGFASLTPEEIERGVRRLATARPR